MDADWQLAGVDEICAAIAKGLLPLSCEEPLKLSEWADQNYYLSPESSSIEGPWLTMPYQRGIMNVISNPDVPIITIFKSARTGGTKMICAAIGYFASHLHRNQLVYQPTETDAKKFVAKDIDPMLRDCKVVGDKLRCKVGAKHQHNTNSTKSFHGSVLDIFGGKTPRSFRYETKDNVYYDELSAFDKSIGGEGDPVKLGDKRLETSPFKKSVRNSTPKLEGSCHISNSAKTADVRLKRFLPCPFCGERFPLEWELFSWVGEGAELEVKVTCPACKSDKIRHHHYSEMDANGRWESDENGMWIDDDDLFHDASGGVIKSPRHVCFRLWTAYSYYSTWEDIVAEYLAADAAEKGGDASGMITFTNTTLGRAYAQKVGEQRGAELITRLNDEVAGDLVPEWALGLFLTADIQKHGIWYEIRAWKENRTSRLVQSGYLPKDIGFDADLEMEGDFKALGAKAAERFKTANGEEMGIGLVLVDSGYRSAEVYTFCKFFDGLAYPTKGDTKKAKPLNYSNQEYMPGTKTPIPGGILLVVFDANYWKDKLDFRLKVNRTDPGAWIINKDAGPDYPKHYTAEIKNKETDQWENPNKKANHLWDCGVLQLVAFQIWEDRGYWKRLAEERKQQEEQAKAQPQAQEKEQAFQPVRRPGLW